MSTLMPMSSSSPVLCGRAVPAPGAPPVPISQAEFVLFQRWIFEVAGITLPGTKQALVANRLARRLALHGLHSYRDYFALLQRPGQAAEVQVAVDLLTTNETYFFREPKHFDFLRQQALGARGRAQPFRVWSAASSSGEEAYSIAMVLADCLGDATPWEVMGSDISTRVLQGAQQAHYPLERARHIPGHYLKRFCLKGGYEYLDTLLIKHPLRRRVNFRHINLNVPLPPVGTFDVVFLRNVMIYFNHDTRREVATRVLAAIKPGGHFLVGHSESLTDIVPGVQPLAPSIYRKLPG
ncbi:MAG: protein-glutamate O-methyltransferase CheR [Macromonas bipunctata]|nr:protein-glutamate O-methyltransferase CheR [Macromonas bipunctata]